MEKRLTPGQEAIVRAKLDLVEPMMHPEHIGMTISASVFVALVGELDELRKEHEAQKTVIASLPMTVIGEMDQKIKSLERSLELTREDVRIARAYEDLARGEASRSYSALIEANKTIAALKLDLKDSIDFLTCSLETGLDRKTSAT